MEPEPAARPKLLLAAVFLALELLLCALAWFILDGLGQHQASFPVTMVVWGGCLLLYASPVQAAITAWSHDGRSCALFVFMVSIAIWAAASTTHLPSMYPILMGIVALEIAGRDSSWRTASVALVMLLLGTGLTGYLVETGVMPSAFPAATSHHLSVILALFGSLMTVRGVGRARKSDALRQKLAEEQAHHHAELRHAATHDALTGTLSRRGLSEVLAGPAGRSPGLAVIYLDLDGFKAVNDQHGHAVGDALLVQVAERFGLVVPEPGFLARMGGDEFVVVAPGLRAAEEASALAAALCNCLHDPFRLGPETVTVGVSAGMAWSTEPPQDPESLMRAADAGMYENKRASAAKAGSAWRGGLLAARVPSE
ncbi:GGDEF domain-containing protein [Kineosporia rhizophila]|uniref:GGDEF domain-containing protein n=1 Tax=Kineosporia TaxID=49184 RepID=UPI001E2E19FE|nr:MULTISPECIES: GGDEF domain-containing protein [Kineosporia]MCE0537850.1 GGDEF domain-containing protein [Kineosporia rhizophila]GLY15839.1 hypothetical protein Kisp01_28540 [Kineosporia sp. NBRC 101677]